MAKRKAKGRLALALAATTLTLCACACLVLASMHERASSPRPDPAAKHSEPAPESGDPFPHVDWEYWLSVNEDVVGWVTVPGTSIDQPIVHADAAEPQYYLWHDVYREPNYLGCPYLDADCDPSFSGPNSVVFGHNMGGGDRSMFGDFEWFSDAAYAADHATILLQTPEEKMALDVKCVVVANGGEAVNCTSFESLAEFRFWYEERISGAALVLDESTPDSVVTFCTCSYTRWDNERTLVLASPRA